MPNKDINRSSENLKKIPEDIRNNIDVEKLNLSNNKIVEFPEWIGELKNLTELNLSGNCIKKIPDTIRHLNLLTKLDLSHNSLEKLPTDLGNLKYLSVLNLEANQFKVFPESIADLANIVNLNLQNNQLKEIPVWIENLDHLTHLQLRNNELNTFPFEILEEGNNDMICNWLTSERDTLRTARLVMLGGEQVGKTALSQILASQKIGCMQTQTRRTTTTNTLSILPWKISLNNQSFSFHLDIWDFKGNKTGKLLFQLLDARSSIYLYVMDCNQITSCDEQYLPSWLDLMSSSVSYGYRNVTKRVILPIINRIDATQDYLLKITEESHVIKKIWQHSTIKKLIPISALKNQGLTKLKENIEEAIPSIWTNILTEQHKNNWLAIITTLKSQTANYLKLRIFQRICRHNAVYGEEITLLLKILHRLGIIIYEAEDTILSKYVILSQSWIEKALSTFLEYQQNHNKTGFFTHKGLIQAWDGHKKAEAILILKQLFIQYGICYEIEPMTKYLIPFFLPVAPKTSNSKKEVLSITLTFRYKNFMPLMVFHQFIIDLYEYVDPKQYYLNKATVSIQKTTIEIIENPKAKEIKVRFQGNNIKSGIKLILERFEKINQKLLTTATYNTYIQYQDGKENEYEYDDLQQRLTNGIKEIYCRVIKNNIPIRGLLEGEHDSFKKKPKEMTKKTLIEEIIHHLEENQHEELVIYLKRLINYLTTNDLKNRTIILIAQYNELKQQYWNDEMTYEEKKKEQAKINRRTLKLLDDVKK